MRTLRTLFRFSIPQSFVKISVATCIMGSALLTSTSVTAHFSDEQHEHDPVIMIPGMGGGTYNMTTMENGFSQDGWDSARLFTWTDVDQMNKDMEVSAATIRDKVNDVLQQTGARKVVLATWSASTIAGRYYIKNLGGIEKISQFISFAGPHHGISIWNQCSQTATACRNQWGPIPNTAWLNDLNSGTEVPGAPAIKYLTLRGSSDTNATPVDTAILEGADENFLVNGATHFSIITDADALKKMRDFIVEHEGDDFSFNDVELTSSGPTLQLNGSFSAEGLTLETLTATAYRVNIYLNAEGDTAVGQYNISFNSDGSFSLPISDLPSNEHYYVSLKATLSAADEGSVSNESLEVQTNQVALGMPVTRPELSALNVAVNEQSATFSGHAADVNGQLDHVLVMSDVEQDVWHEAVPDSAGDWSYEFSSLPYGDVVLSAKAVNFSDGTGRVVSSTSSISATISRPYTCVSADVNGHISRYTNYPTGWGACDINYNDLFSKYGLSTSFSLCRNSGEEPEPTWCEDPVNLPSPVVTPVPGTPTPTPPPTPTPNPGTPTPSPTPTITPQPDACEDYTTWNVFHRINGRAEYSYPSYTAKGSGEAMSGGAYARSNLYSTNENIWYVGLCP